MALQEKHFSDFMLRFKSATSRIADIPFCNGNIEIEEFAYFTAKTAWYYLTVANSQKGE